MHECDYSFMSYFDDAKYRYAILWCYCGGIVMPKTKHPSGRLGLSWTMHEMSLINICHILVIQVI